MKINKILALLPIACSTYLLISCIACWKTAFIVKNCTKDTLLLEITYSDTLDSDIYWEYYPEDTIRTMESDTICIYIHGEKMIINKNCYAQPDSNAYVGSHLFFMKDTCYIYAIKWWVVTHYTLDEIRKRKLYDRRVVTKKDFVDRIYEYKINKTNHEYK